MMTREITPEVIVQELEPTIEHVLRTYKTNDDGTIETRDAVFPYHRLVAPSEISSYMHFLASVFSVTGSRRLRKAASDFLNYITNCCVKHKGVYFWVCEPGVTLCCHGRIIRRLYASAKVLGKHDTIKQLGKMLLAWPYCKKEHRFIDYIPGVVKELTRDKARLSPYNMQLEGAADSILIGEETNNSQLASRGEDVLVNYWLPNQRRDKLWDYSPRGGVDAEQINYSLYCLDIVAALLAKEKWRNILAEPINASWQKIGDDYSFGDGSIYAPVHWGWDHIWESTVMYAYVGWMLTRYCGCNYEREVFHAIDWLLRCKLDMAPCWPHESLVSISYLLFEKVNVAGEQAPTKKILATLKKVERNIKVPEDHFHRQYYYGTTLYIQQNLKKLIKKVQEFKAVLPRP